jgi:FtsZ-binding cell division protein ZapB
VIEKEVFNLNLDIETMKRENKTLKDDLERTQETLKGLINEKMEKDD